MNSMKSIGYFFETYILIPSANAASPELIGLIGRINKHIINPFIVLLFTVALVFFTFGMYNFFTGKDNSDSLEKGKAHMIWGIVGMAIMVSVFGIMKFLTSTLGVPDVTGNVQSGGTGNVSGLINTQ